MDQGVHFNYSGFQDDVYIVNYCDQNPLGHHIILQGSCFSQPLIWNFNTYRKKRGGFAGEYMEGNNDAINANHTSVGYGSCYKAHCDKEKRDLA